MIICDQILTEKGWLQQQAIEIENGLISAIRPAHSHELAQSLSGRLLPGLIDVQVNGGGGALFNATPTVDALYTMMKAHRQYGTTAMMPTLITDTVDVMIEAAHAIEDARAQGVPGIVGVHFEGPWLSTARKGVHSEQYIRPPTDEEIAILTRPALGQVMVTLAPETVDVSTIQRLANAGIHVFLGHSNATAEQVNKALAAGAKGFTHLYNAMSPLASRAPGMVGVAMADEASYAGLIVDGYHVDPQSCRVAIRAKGRDKVMLVTDAMAIAATSLDRVPFFDTEILRQGNKLTTPDGTLAGSCLTMIEAVQNAVSMCRVSLEDAVEMAALTPAKMLGLNESLGTITVGKEASFMCVDEALSITHLWQQGQPVALGE